MLKLGPVIIHSLKLIEVALITARHVSTSIVEKACSVRALARDLAIALGTCGYVSALRRTRVGPFGLDQAILLEKLGELSHKGDALTALLALRSALDDIPV